MLRFQEPFLLNQVNSRTVRHGIACFRQWQLLLPSDTISQPQAYARRLSAVGSPDTGTLKLALSRVGRTLWFQLSQTNQGASAHFYYSCLGSEAIGLQLSELVQPVSGAPKNDAEGK